MNIVYYGNDILRKKAEKIDKITSDIKHFADEMFKAMYKNDGVGLAAPQVGKSIKMVVIDQSVGSDPSSRMVLINPEIIERQGEQCEEEGCLSFPAIVARVKRPARVKIRYMNLEGETVEQEVEGLLARVFDHEIDHLEGVLFIDYIKGLEKHLLMKKIKKSMTEELWNKAS